MIDFICSPSYDLLAKSVHFTGGGVNRIHCSSETISCKILAFIALILILINISTSIPRSLTSCQLNAKVAPAFF
jgi:hypothetical protein